MNFQPVTIGVEPCPYVAVFVVRGVVLNEYRSLPSIAASQLFQEREVRGSVEDGVLPVMESSLPQFNGPKIFTLCAVRSRELPGDNQSGSRWRAG